MRSRVFPRRGLLIKNPGSTASRITIVLASLVLCGGYVVLLRSGSITNIFLMHNLTVTMIAMATYSLVGLPLAGGIAISVVVLAVGAWGWAAAQSTLLGADLLGLLVLGGLASLQQRRRLMRLHRLKQRLDDFDEEMHLKAQALRINRGTREKLQRKLERYQRLQTIAEQLSRLVELEGIAQLAVEQAFELIGKSDACLLLLVDKHRRELALHASKRSADVPVIRTKQGDQFDHYVLRTQRPLLVNDVRRDFRFSLSGASERPIGSVIACPLLLDQRAAGVLRLDSRKTGAYTQDDLRFLDILLDLIDTALANASLFAEAQRLATTDGLTGLSRRQPFLDQLGRELARTARSREPVTVLMLDIDEFKRYNDQFGHTAGDIALKHVAEVLRTRVPAGGTPARYGGEEFAVVLPGMMKDRGVELANGIRRDIEKIAQLAGQGVERRVTVSVGVAAFPEDGQTDLELVRRADEQLYQAKRSGRNRVCAS